jgi:pimeloyl-ACP methyl ester carboxylesterase
VRPVEIGDVVLQMEPPEAGRYHAPILLVPGLFQSAACWRPFTSMLAHRGWEVYVLVLDAATRAARQLGDKVVLFGADIGASVALAVSATVNPLALALFAPAEPAHVGAALKGSLGFFEKRRFAQQTGVVLPPAKLGAKIPHPHAPGAEPRVLIDDLLGAVAFRRPTQHPPAIVFAPTDDALVAAEHALGFAGSAQAKAARARLTGRWWPMTGWQAACDEVHRFLILTLGDRVVEFPDEIIAD